uniref:hemoblobin-interacting domain-containing protein n=1 Tax=Clostridium sp. TaxID=1506 RepID=UPI003076B313
YKEQKITVEVEDSSEEETQIEVSGFRKAEKAGMFDWGADKYIASFKGISGDDLKAYIGAINEVWVNDKKYNKAYSATSVDDGCFAAYSSDTNMVFNYDGLKISSSGFSTTGITTIVIKAEDYDDVTFTIDENFKLIKVETTLIADEVLPSEIVTTPTEGVTTPEQTPAEDTTPEEPKTNDENKADVPDGDKKNETDDANKAPEVDEDKKEDSDESKDTSDEKKDETSDKGDADKDDSKDESGETGDDSKKNETDESKDNDSKKDETGDVKDDTSDKEESDGGKGDASEKEESVSEEE